MKIIKIISGGQSGVDRAAFDFALENNIEIGGYIPKNRWAEDGKISDKYPNLIETKTGNQAERTEMNVINSDATLILSHGELTGGSLLTRELCQKHQKPFLHIKFSASTLAETIGKTSDWLVSIRCNILNVAGSRASEDTLIYENAKEFLGRLFYQSYC